MAEVTTVANRHSWDTSAYFSDEPSVTPGTEYLEVVMDEEHEKQLTTVKTSKDFIFFIVSAPPKIPKMESLLVENIEQTKTFPDSETNKSVFIEFGEQSDLIESSNPEGEEMSGYEYENFWESAEVDDTINLEGRDNSNDDKWKEIDDIDNDDFLETLDIESFNAIDLNKKSQPLTILATEKSTLNKTYAKNDLEKSVKIANDVNPMLSIAGIAGGGIFIVCSLLGTERH